MLTQRIGKSAAELITIEGISADAVFLLGKDTRSFQELLAAMIDGNAELRIKPVRTSNSRQRLAALEKDRTSMKEQVDAILHDLKNLVSAREAQGKLLVELAALGALSANACSSGENRSGMPPGV
jgi:twitching motility protein PilJ